MLANVDFKGEPMVTVYYLLSNKMIAPFRAKEGISNISFLLRLKAHILDLKNSSIQFLTV